MESRVLDPSACLERDRQLGNGKEDDIPYWTYNLTLPIVSECGGLGARFVVTRGRVLNLELPGVGRLDKLFAFTFFLVGELEGEDAGGLLAESDVDNG